MRNANPSSRIQIGNTPRKTRMIHMPRATTATPAQTPSTSPRTMPPSCTVMLLPASWHEPVASGVISSATPWFASQSRYPVSGLISARKEMMSRSIPSRLTGSAGLPAKVKP